jgi:tetratricopeptide (TPR) repeat protein
VSESLAAGTPTDVEIIRRISDREDRGLLALSIPEAVTDSLAVKVLRASGLGPDAAAFASLVRGCDFTVDRNNEWRLSHTARQYLQPLCLQEPKLWTDIHTTLLEESTSSSEDAAALPIYLRDPAGYAYHLAALDPEAGLNSYLDLAVAAEFDVPHRTAWLANRLANDQRGLGVLPVDSTELDFLTAMATYCDGPRDVAIELLRPFAADRRYTMPAAVATHLVGRHDMRRNSGIHYRLAEKLIRRSIRIGEHLENWRHVAQAQHTLALLLLIHDRARNEQNAYRLLDTSLATLREEQDAFGVAKVLHTYGQALAFTNSRRDWDRARTMYVQSLRIGRDLGKRRHEADVLRSLANLLQRSHPDLGRNAYDVAERLAPRNPDGGPDVPASTKRPARRKRRPNR